MRAMKNKRFKWLIIPAVIVLLVAAYVSWAFVAAAPVVQPLKASSKSSQTVPTASLPWPTTGQAAIGLNDLGVVATYGTQKPSPMASTAKLITALCVLKKYPLSPGESGPTITLTPADVAIYNQYQSEDGSDMVVVSGEQLSEFQMLEGLLLPSADNIADSLAIWAFGSLSNYNTYATQYIKTIGLNATHIGIDASGYDPSSTSTASDLVRLGEQAMENPEIASIVDTPEVTGLPVVGTIKNVNFLLGQDNIIGIKTGNTDQAGGVYVSASKVTVNSQPLTVITAEMQLPSLFDAIEGSLPLIKAAQTNFAGSSISDSASGTMVGKYLVPWSGRTVKAVTSQPLQLQTWGGSQVSINIHLSAISDKTGKDQAVGTITASSDLLKESNKSLVVLNSLPGKPSKWWLLLHPEYVIHF